MIFLYITKDNIIVMKKTLLIIGLISCSVCMFSQKNKKNVVLQNSTDSISYSYGMNLAKQGLVHFLKQQNIIADTTNIRADYTSRISTELDRRKKTDLEKELKHKLDSITKANRLNISDFISGINAILLAKEKRIAYNEGIAIGNQLQKMIPAFSEELYGKDKKDEINTFLLIKGLEDALTPNTPLVENSSSLIEAKMKEAQELKDEQKKAQSADVIAEGERFLAENRNKEGVVELPNGLQYKIIKEGTGSKPSASDRVKVHYRGTLLDGTVFDSSIDRGEPIVFGVSQVIQGWTEALQLMPVGSKWMLYIPYQLAYGARETGPIKPYSTLIFEVELLGIE